MTDATRTARVEIAAVPAHGYDVRIGDSVLRSALADPGALFGTVPKRVVLVADAGVPSDACDAVRSALIDAGIRVTLETIEPTERAKSIETLSRVLSKTAEARLERSDAIVALGGGIVGDVAGFAAASYRRGIPIIQCPSTLLSMVDASVGGKTGINLTVNDGAGERLVKNMAGAFWQPRAVLADVSLLRSLPDRTMRCGLAECLKHGVLGGSTDADLFAWTRGRLPSIMDRDPATLTELVYRNVSIKAAVVAADDRETAADGGRATLNLGHTFGHAIEPMAHLSPTGDMAHAPLQHGEAVALGLVAAAATSRAMDFIDAGYADDIRGTVAAAGLPTSVAGLPSDDALVDAMLDDKKVTGGKLRLVLPSRDAACRVVTDPPRDAVVAGWAAIRA